ncbi:MAG: type II toxin-antitoxin system RelE/ParE family toxin [Aquisalinus sp.]|nr:type II toxin-antitoxin system RelE/ParE family toxin [Aquisalinus sp.]
MELTSFRSKDLRTFWQDDEAGKTALAALWAGPGQLGLSDGQLEKLRAILSFLSCFRRIDEFLALPYAGKGKRAGEYCIAISAVWYLTFKLNGEKISRLDLEEMY